MLAWAAGVGPTTLDLSSQSDASDLLATANPKCPSTCQNQYIMSFADDTFLLVADLLVQMSKVSGRMPPSLTFIP